MKWTPITRFSVSLLCAAGGFAAGAAPTNAPPTAAKQTARPQDYRLLLQRVRIKQQEKSSLDDLQKAVQSFQMRFGRLPDELKDLVERGILSELPAPPHGTGYFYDRLVGNVRLAALPSAAAGGTNTPVNANLFSAPK